MTGQRVDKERYHHILITLAGRRLRDSTVGVYDLSKLLPGEVGRVDGGVALDLIERHGFTSSFGERFIRFLDRFALNLE